MKPFSLLLTILSGMMFLCIPVNGQGTFPKRPHPPEPVGISGIKRGTATQRIIASSNRQGVAGNFFANTDSAVYAYSNGRGGDDINNYFLNYDGLYSHMSFDEATSWVASGQAYIPGAHMVKKWNNQNRLLNSTRQTWKGNAWVNVEQERFELNGFGDPILRYKELWNSSTQSFESSDKDSNTYIIPGKFDSKYHFYWNKTTKNWIYAFSDHLTYDAGYNIETWTIEYASGDKTQYKFEYDDSSNIISYITYEWDMVSKTYEEYVRTKNIYNANNHFVGKVNSKGPGRIGVDSLIYTSLNSAGEPLSTVSYKWSNGWVQDIRNTLTYSKPTLEINTFQEKWTGSKWENDLRSFSFYNSQDLLIDNYFESWTGSAWEAQIYTYAGGRLYYEDYIVGVSKVEKEGILANLFPVPANHLLTLAVKWPSRQHFNAVIYNIEGKVCAKWEDDANGFYTKDISIADLKNGIYYICINGENNSWSSPFTVQR